MSETTSNLFDRVDEPVQVRRLKTAGVHRGVKYMGVDYIPPETKKGENGHADTEISARANFKFIIRHEIKDTTENKILHAQDLLFEEQRFCPPLSAAEVKFFDNKYQGNVVVGKKSAEEQMPDDWERFGMFLCQLGTAFGVQFDAVKARLSKYFKGYKLETFKALVEGFNKEFPPDKLNEKHKLIDIKTVWSNSKEKHTSFLRLGRVSQTNLVFAPYDEKAEESTLFMNEYEVKNIRALYTGQDNPPAGKEEIVDEKMIGDMKPIHTDSDDLLEGTGLADQTDSLF